MTRMTIICHAATEAVRAARFPSNEDLEDLNTADPSLLPTVAAGRWLVGPERRTTSTAAAVCGGRPFTVDDDLRDWNCGRWKGMALADINRREPAALAAWLSDAAAAPHGGESLLELLARIGLWLDAQADRGVRTAAVTHPAVLRAAIVRTLDVGAAAFWRIDAQPLCRAQISHDGRRWVLQGLIPPRHVA